MNLFNGPAGFDNQIDALMESPFVDLSEVSPATVEDPPADWEREFITPFPGFADELASGSLASILSPDKNTKASALNRNLVQKSGLSVNEISSSLAKVVNPEAVRQALLSFNQSNKGSGYNVNSSAIPTTDAVFTEATHQFQVACYINPKEHDGVMGNSTLDSLGFVKHGLRPKLSSAGFYGQTQLNRSDVKSRIQAATNSEFNASNWFDYIVRPSWLGVKISDGIHLVLMRKLREAENWLMNQPQYMGMTQAALGKALGFNADTRFSGARLSAAKQAMHGFGLAIDIHVPGNPWIGAGWVKHDKILLRERVKMIEALRAASGGQSLPGKTIFEYLDSIARATGNDTRQAYDTLKKRNDEFIAYLKGNPQELGYWKKSQSFGNRNPLNGFLNLHRDLVYALRQIAGLAWGAIDFGPYASGDIMHFDTRTIGVGRIISEKTGGFVQQKNHPAINQELFTNEAHGNDAGQNDDLELHEAIEESYWETGEVEDGADEQLEDLESGAENPFYQTDFQTDHESELQDLSRALALNRKYSEQLGWNQFHAQINDLLLPYSGKQNVSLGEADFAEAVAGWQRGQGFSEKDSDGIIGPKSWAKMRSALGLNAQAKSTPALTSGDSVASRILQYTSIIEKYGSLYNINPNVVRGIIASESGGNPRSGEGRNGYKGLMQAGTTTDQLQPEISVKTGTEKFVTFRNKTLNPWLKKLGISQPSEDNENYLKACLSCYNAGPVTALKAIQYAHSSGDWQQWLSPDHYKRALLFSGGYAQYPRCNQGKSSSEIDMAKKERLKYRFKTSGWKNEPDHPEWRSVSPSLNPVLRCWIETKFENTPGYLDKFIRYFKYFETLLSD